MVQSVSTHRHTYIPDNDDDDAVDDDAVDDDCDDDDDDDGAIMTAWDTKGK